MCGRSFPLFAALVIGLAACERAPAPEAPPEAPAPPPATAPDESLYPVEIEPGISLAVRKTGSREYMLYGFTDRTPELTLSVEDGHNILFGPIEIGVDQQRFRVDFIIDSTDRDHIFFYITDAEGDRLAVVPVDTARELTTAGPAADLPEPPELGATQVGDRRTHVSALGLESPHFRVSWPTVREGDRSVLLRGQTDLPHFRAELRRYEQVLATAAPRVVGREAAWNNFATELRVPGGLREGDAVVLARGDDPGGVELIFQPIRN